MLKFYWSLGRDIVALKAETRWGSKFFKNLSRDLKEANPLATCFSPKNLLYMKNFYCMYLPYTEIGQQVADQLERDANLPQLGVKNFSVFFFITFVLCKGDIALCIAKK